MVEQPNSHTPFPVDIYSPATIVVAPINAGYKADYYTTGTNDNVPIQLALNAINTLGGGKLLLKQGTYLISSQLLVYNNTWIQGEGINTILRKTTGISNNRIMTNANTTTGNSNIHYSDFYIDGNYQTGDIGITWTLVQVTNALVERVWIVNGMQGFKTDTCTNVVIRDCYADSNRNWNYYQFNGKRVKIQSCVSLNAMSNVNEGFGMALYANDDGCEIIDNYVFNSAHNGIQVNAGSATKDDLHILIKDNRVDSAGYRGIFITDDQNTRFHNKRIVVSNNRVTGSAQQGIYLIDNYDTYVSGNKSTLNLNSDGITYENCNNIISVGNISTGNNVGLRINGNGNTVVSVCDWIHGNTTDFAPGNAASGLITIGPEDITLDGQSARTISLSRELTSGTAGNNLTVQPGGAFTGGTDLSGGTLQLNSGIATGNGASVIKMNVVPGSQGSGITDRTPTNTVFIFGAQSTNLRARLSMGTGSAGAFDGITIGGQFAYQIGMIRETTSNTAGNSLTIQSGGATTGGTDKGAGDLILTPGISTGQGGANVRIQTMTRALSSGTGDNAATDRIIATSPKSLTNASATTIISQTIASGTTTGGVLHYTVEVTDNTDFVAESGVVVFAAANKAGTVTSATTKLTAAASIVTGSATLSVTFTQTNASPNLIQVNANVGVITPATGYPRITYVYENLTQQAITIS